MSFIDEEIFTDFPSEQFNIVKFINYLNFVDFKNKIKDKYEKNIIDVVLNPIEIEFLKKDFIKMFADEIAERRNCIILYEKEQDERIKSQTKNKRKNKKNKEDDGEDV